MLRSKGGITFPEDERTELKGLRQEVKTLRVEKEVLKKASVSSSLLCKRNKVIFNFIKCNRQYYAVRMMCRVMGVSPSACYVWVKRPGQLISADTLHLHRQANCRLINAI
jgi:transposase-like protein